MGLTRELRNHPETGAPGYSVFTNPDPDKVLFYTGPLAMSDFLLADGTVYNVSDHAIQVASLDHAHELDHHLARSYEASGVLDVPADESPTGELVKFAHPLCRFCTAADAYTDQKMALASAAAENASLNGLTGVGSTNVMPFVSLHSASPGVSGLNENANTGSYARQAASWAAASGGSVATSGSLTFATAGSVAVLYIGTWSSGTFAGGTYAIGAALTAGVTSASIVVATAAASFSSS